jgi:hypothetical protein
MLPAHFGKEVSGWPSTPGLYVFMPPADTLSGFLEILALPFQVSRQSLIECDDGILAVSLSVFLQLGLALRLKRDHLHDWRLRALMLMLLKRKRHESPCQAPSPGATISLDSDSQT